MISFFFSFSFFSFFFSFSSSFSFLGSRLPSPVVLVVRLLVDVVAEVDDNSGFLIGHELVGVVIGVLNSAQEQNAKRKLSGIARARRMR